MDGGPAGSFNPGPTWQIAGTGDFNGDGRADILWQNERRHTRDLADERHHASLEVGAVGPNPGPSWHVAGTGDFNGDGGRHSLAERRHARDLDDERHERHFRGRGRLVQSGRGLAHHRVTAA